MMTEEGAREWARKMCTNGTYPLREAYRKQYGIGSAVEKIYDDPLFTLGIEYGLLMAVEKIYDRLSEIVV
jgi:hypothetical protein